MCTLSFVCSFHAAAGTVHTPFGGNEIHGPDSKVAQQGDQTSDGVQVFSRGTAYMVIVCVCVHVCMQCRSPM